MNIIKKIWNARFFIFSLPATIYFNLKNFPLRQAIKLPVFLCIPRIKGSGKYTIEGEIKPGMIKIGFPLVSIFRGIGCSLENNGHIVFKGSALFGGQTAFSIGEKGRLCIGDEFCNQYGLKIVCYNQVTFGNAVRIGWETLVCDTDFHAMKSADGLQYSKGYGPINIGDEVWIGSFCKIYKNTEIPGRCTVASDTLLNKKIECRPYSLIYREGDLKAKYTGWYRDFHDDKIHYE